MERSFLCARRNIDFKEGETDIAQCGEKPGLSETSDIGFFGRTHSYQCITDSFYRQQNGEEDGNQTIGVGPFQPQFFGGQCTDLGVQSLCISFGSS